MTVSVRNGLVCLSVALNALCAGGIFTFPLISPALAAHLKLTQPQLTTIVLAGMMSQYTVAAFVGSAIDNYGPNFCSLVAALLFSVGWGGFSWRTSMPAAEAPADSFYTLTFFFLLAGLGTVFSYFSSLFSASIAFPSHISLASGASMALFGLSPMFLSTICSRFFMDPETGFVRVSQFTWFLSYFTGLVCLFGAFNLRHLRPRRDSLDQAENGTESSPPDERTPLLDNDAPQTPSKPTIANNLSVQELLKTADFWLLGFFCVCVLGVSEMIISNVGSIVLSLPPTSTKSELLSYATPSTARQVNFLSISSTMTRLAIGPLADYVSPIASYLPCGTLEFPRKHRISRFVFLAGPALLLDLVFVWMEFGARSQEHLWVLSIGTGIAYSTVFTVLPSIISSLWGLQNVGRNFGIMMYAPFTGTPLFSYLYAFIAAAHTDGELCVGRSCWQLTFWITTFTSLLACILAICLWKRWQGKM